MYFNKKNNFFHGVMFHHFHDYKNHLPGQGSISAKKFKSIINFIGRENIINPEEFIERYKKKTLKPKNICLTFDDSLKCQFDIAIPILEEYKIKAFFFIYSSAFTNKPNLLEVFRYFRLNKYKSINRFYNEFFYQVNELKGENVNFFIKKNTQNINKKLKKFKFYSRNDVKFRLVRDNLLNQDEYNEIMFKMFKQKKFDFKKCLKKIILSQKDLRTIYKYGHTIGLHSHNHSTSFKDLSYNLQLKEYKTNLQILKKMLKLQSIKSMSHPCGSYNNYTLKILKKLKVEIGFKQVMNNNNTNKSKYEICRDDHTNILKRINF